VRLLLPELPGARAPRALPARAGYAGTRRRVLVVDNEEVDRTLLAGRLEALGFDVLQAASGHAAMGLLHEMAQERSKNGWQKGALERSHTPPGNAPVDAILMDLAMPGIDGWETIRALRRQGLSSVPVAVVSANAFDKGQDNDCGIGAADFITKPVRFDELLDWLGARLKLQWLDPAAGTPALQAPAPTMPPASAADGPLPPRAQLLALQEVLGLGYPRGVQRVLDDIAKNHPECAAFAATLRALAQGFEFDRMVPLVRQALERSRVD